MVVSFRRRIGYDLAASTMIRRRAAPQQIAPARDRKPAFLYQRPQAPRRSSPRSRPPSAAASLREEVPATPRTRVPPRPCPTDLRSACSFRSWPFVRGGFVDHADISIAGSFWTGRAVASTAQAVPPARPISQFNCRATGPDGNLGAFGRHRPPRRQPDPFTGYRCSTAPINAVGEETSLRIVLRAGKPFVQLRPAPASGRVTHRDGHCP